MNRDKRKVIGVVILSLLAGLFITTRSYALDDETIISILENNSDFFVTNNIIHDLFRWVGWSIIKGLKLLADIGENLYKNTFKLLTFSVGTDFETWLETFKPLYIGLLAVSLVILGIILIFNHDKKPDILNNICLSIAVITCGLTIMSSLNGLINTGVNAILEDSSSTSVINDNFYDLYYIDVQKGGLEAMSSDNYETYHYEKMTDKDIKFVDICEVINPGKAGLSSGGKDILNKRLDVIAKTNESGENGLVDVYNGFGWNSGDDDDWFNEFYYRYKVDYLPICIALIAYIIVYFTMAYKVVRIIFELAAERVLAVLYSADITGGQKTMKIIAAIKDGYIVMLFTAVLIKLFTMFNTLISQKFPDDPMVKNFCILFVAFAVCDGPNIVEKLTGIDAGLKSGVGKLIAGYHMSRGAAATATAPLKVAYSRHMQTQLQKGITSAIQSLGKNNTNNNNLDGMPTNDEKNGNSNPNENMGGTQNHNKNDPNSAKESEKKTDNSGINENENIEPEDMQTMESTGLTPEQESLNGFDPEQLYEGNINDMQRMENELEKNSNLSDKSAVEDRPVTFKDGTNPMNIRNPVQSSKKDLTDKTNLS